MTNIHQFSLLVYQFVGKTRFGARIDVVFEKNSWIKAAIEFKRCVAGAGIFNMVVCKLSHWQEACSVILLLVYKSSEVCFHCTVLSLCLTIGLRTESRREFFFDA